MKRITLFLTTVMVSLLTMAQNQSTQVATLNHNGEISCYYGRTAANEAYDDAVDGDIITLSSGRFDVGGGINKSITVRGAGSIKDVENNITCTELHMGWLDGEEQEVYFENIYFDQNVGYMHGGKYHFNKCRINLINPAWSDAYAHFVLFQTIIEDYSQLTYESSAECINSFIMKPKGENSTKNSYIFQNCIVGYPECKNSFYNNSIIIDKTDSTLGSDTNNAYNCVAIGENVSPGYFNNVYKWDIENHTNKVLEGFDIFKEYEGKEFNELVSLELTDEAAKKLIGNDGTQIGIYGGIMPFDPTPSNLIITSFNVDKTTNVDGKLGIEIKLKSNK